MLSNRNISNDPLKFLKSLSKLNLNKNRGQVKIKFYEKSNRLKENSPDLSYKKSNCKTHCNWKKC